MPIRKKNAATLFLSLVTILKLTAQPLQHSGAASAKVNTILLPDFYHYEQAKHGDTTYSYECYDKDMHQINMYDLNDVSEISSIKYVKRFYQSAPKPGNTISPPYLTQRIYTYQHPSSDIWLRINPQDEITHYKIYKDRVLRSEQVTISDPVSGQKRNVTFKYFKTEPVKAAQNN